MIRQRMQRVLDYFAVRNQDYGEYAADLRKACWYLCRYGKQPYYFVQRMTVRELRHGVKAISDYLEMEAKAVRRR